MGAHSFAEAAKIFGIPPYEEKKYIDSHCHYEHSKFSKNRDEVLNEMKNCCEKVICVGTDSRCNAEIIKLTNQYDFLYGMVGFFPTNVHALDPELCSKADKNMKILISQLEHKKCVGLGEIGLDYSWDSVGIIKGERARTLQKEWFRKQAEIAISMNIPISIHSRDAEKDTIEIVDKLYGLKGVVHCFSYGPDAAKFFVEKGFYLGIGGTSTYKANTQIREAIKITPIQNIILETDAPYLSPEPVRKSLNNSSNIKYVIENISNIKGISYDDVVKITNENCKKLFQF